MKDHQYFVYIVCSRSGTLYIGMTNSIYRRALQHKRGEIEGFSSKYHCDRLVYYESFDDVHKAIGREKQLKGWRREKKIALIEARNPHWQDLAEKWERRCCLQASQLISCHPERSWRSRSEGQRSRRTPRKPVEPETRQGILTMSSALGEFPEAARRPPAVRGSFDCGTASHSRSSSFAQDDSR